MNIKYLFNLLIPREKLVMKQSVKRIILFLSAIFVVGSLSSCSQGPLQGSGIRTSEVRILDEVSQVVFDMGGEFSINQGKVTELQVEADDNLIQHINSDVVNGTLQFSTDQPLNHTQPPSFHLTLPTLRGLEVEGSGIIDVLDFEGDAITLHLNGSGEIFLSQADFETLEIVLDGSGKIVGKGEADEQHIIIDGSGHFDGSNLHGAVGEISITGSGNVIMNVARSINATVDGDGRLSYCGNPEITTKQVIEEGELGITKAENCR